MSSSNHFSLFPASYKAQDIPFPLECTDNTTYQQTKINELNSKQTNV
jgi:hypothetical protein